MTFPRSFCTNILSDLTPKAKYVNNLLTLFLQTSHFARALPTPYIWCGILLKQLGVARLDVIKKAFPLHPLGEVVGVLIPEA